MRMFPKQDQAIVCSWRRKLHRVQNHDRKGNKRPITDARFFSLFSETQQKDVIDDIHNEAAEIIKDLSIPLAWLHEAMAVWSNYYGVVSRALEHYVQMYKLAKAHSLFMTSDAYSLFLLAKHLEMETCNFNGRS